MASVALQNVYKYYGQVKAVDDVSLEVNDGEFLVLLGPSGCGKTTVLRMIAGLEEISEGTIHVGDRLANGLHPSDRDVAMVFQSYALYPHMNVFRNLAYGLQRRNMPKVEIASRVSDTALLLGIDGLLQRMPAQLSGGQRQRVALGRAIVRHPQVFLMDEPLSNLDAQLRVQMRTELMRLHGRLGVTTIYVTHDQVEAMTMGHRIVVMNQGRVQQMGPPLQLYRKPENLFVAAFLGAPQMNRIEGALSVDQSELLFASRDVQVPLPLHCDSTLPPQVVLGIRPQHLRVSGVTSDDDRSVVIGRGQVDLVEHLGSESFAFVSVGSASVVAQVSPEVNYSPGNRVQLEVALRHIHLFDAENGSRLCVEFDAGVPI